MFELAPLLKLDHAKLPSFRPNLAYMESHIMYCLKLCWVKQGRCTNSPESAASTKGELKHLFVNLLLYILLECAVAATEAYLRDLWVISKAGHAMPGAPLRASKSCCVGCCTAAAVVFWCCSLFGLYGAAVFFCCSFVLCFGFMFSCFVFWHIFFFYPANVPLLSASAMKPSIACIASMQNEFCRS